MNKGIRKFYSEISGTYELVNHVLTLGLDVLWRKRAAKVATIGGGTTWLDVCTGTGEMAVNLRRLADESTILVTADFSIQMIREAAKKPELKQIAFNIADASFLPFRNETFDVVTISFATRNINVSRDNLIRSFREFHRILKPGGRFVNLETSQPPSQLIRRLFHLYIRFVVMPIGYTISGSRASYQYLAHTIPRFYNAEDFSNILREAGFTEVTFDYMFLGAAATHKGVK